MDDELRRFLDEVEAYLLARPMTATTFGKESVNDPAIVGRMRQGRAITTKTISAMRRFMQDKPATTVPGHRPEHERSAVPMSLVDRFKRIIS